MTNAALLVAIDDARLPGRDGDWSRDGQARLKARLAELVSAAQACGLYPAETVAGNPNTVLAMVEGYGARWFEWRGPLNCRACGADLRDLKAGPPFKREIGRYDEGLDRTVGYRCPDCGGSP